jgi:phage-related protein
VSGVTAQQAKELADSIQNTTPIDNDAAMAAENMLLTFTNIGKNQFPAATKAVTDMATAMNGGLTPSSQQLSSTAIQVGKALNDPVLGVTALQRVGVRLTDQQKEQVAQMVKVGDTAGAQKLILGELNREFGGSGAAALNTYAGKQQQMKNAITDAKVEIGNTIMQAIQPMEAALAKFVSGDRFKQYLKDIVQGTKDLVQWVTDATKFYMAHRAIINEVAKVLLIVAGAVYAVTTAVKIWEAAQAALNAVMDMNPWTLALMALVAVIVVVIDHWKQISAFVGKVWADIKRYFDEGIDFIKSHWDLLLDILLGPLGFVIGEIIKHWQSIKDTVTQVFNDIAGVVTTVMNFIWNDILKPIFDVVSAAFHIWLDVVTYVFDVIRGVITVAWNWIYNNIIAPVIGFIEQRFQIMVANLTAWWNFIVSIATAAWNWIWNNVISPVINTIMAGVNFLAGVIANVWNWIAGVASGAWNFIVNAARGAWNWVVGIWNAAYGFFSGIVGHITGVFSSIGGSISSAFSGAFNGVKGIVTGTINWMIDRVNSVIHTINNTAGKLPGVPHIGDIPHLYTGTRDFAGGLAVVGDVFGAGGEVVALPKGADVYSNSESKDILNQAAGGGGDTHIHIEYNGRGQFTPDDATSMAKQIVNALKAQGLTMSQIGNLR